MGSRNTARFILSFRD